MRHASLLRPLGEGGKLKLARDMAELELAASQSLLPLASDTTGPALAASYRSLRALRPLLFLETAALVSAPSLRAPTSEKPSRFPRGEVVWEESRR